MKSVTITIGQMSDNQHSLRLDVLRLVDTRLLIQASSGSGKSWLLRLIAECVAGKVQTLILDPEGEFATLRERFDMLLVGEGGEAPADVRSARLLARKLVELGVSAIIDLYDLGDWDHRREWTGLFLDGLMDVPKAHWHPLLVMIDEAHMLAPESAGKSRADDPVTRSRRAVITLMSAGRKRGFCGLLATQRISKLHKDAIAECKNVFIGGTTLDIDQQRAADVLGIGKAERVGLRDLEPGEFYTFGPAILGKGVLRFKSDRVLTTHPQLGQRHTLEVPKASEAVQKLAGALQDLTRMITQVRSTPVPRLAPQPVRAVTRPPVVTAAISAQPSAAGPLRAGERRMLQELSRRYPLKLTRAQLGTLSGFTPSGGTYTTYFGTLRRHGLITEAPNGDVEITQAGLDYLGADIPPAPQTTAELQTLWRSRLRAGEAKMLDVLIESYPHAISRDELGQLSGFAVSGGTFGTYLGTLRRNGLTDVDGDQVCASLTLFLP